MGLDLSTPKWSREAALSQFDEEAARKDFQFSFDDTDWRTSREKVASERAKAVLSRGLPSFFSGD